MRRQDYEELQNKNLLMQAMPARIFYGLLNIKVVLKSWYWSTHMRKIHGNEQYRHINTQPNGEFLREKTCKGVHPTFLNSTLARQPKNAKPIAYNCEA